MIEKPEDRVLDVEIQQEMRKAYLDYAMSVIVARALPDVRDGLKPVQRRILWTMHEMGLRSDRPFRKSAAIVGDVMGKYHPHGDAPIYDALVRLAQPWSLRYPLIEGQGNFGSIDDDPPGAPRYCVTGDTMVRTPTATLPINALVTDAEPNSDTLIDIDVLDRLGRSVLATKFFHSGVHTTLRLVTREGYKLTGTPNHPVLCLVSIAGVPMLLWKLLEEIEPGDRVVLLCRPPTELGQVTPREERLAFLAGAMVAEGWASERRAGLNNTDKEYFDAALAAYDAIVGGRRYTNSRWIRNTFVHELDVHNLTALRASPLAEMIGARSAQKRIPSFIWRGRLAFKAAFLRALFEGDGSWRVNPRNSVEVSYSTYSPKLADEVQLLLLEFGVVSRQWRSERGETKVYLTNQKDVRRFARYGGFWGQKQRRLERDLAAIPATRAHRSTDHVPFLAAYVRREKSGRWVDRDWLDRHSIDRIEHWESNPDEILAHITNEEVRKVVAPLVDGSYYYASVHSVEPAGDQEVYSIRVASRDHAFITNGFVSHNTEARPAAISAETLADIERETVDFLPNYDSRHNEPTVLPAKLPNLIVNGSSGIAVGMATNIPPHNLREIATGIKRLVEDPELTADDLCETVLGPDFPGGGVVYRYEEQKNVETGALERVDVIRRAYANGRGRIVVRSRAHFETLRGNREAIVVSELPYAVNKAALIEKIAELVNAKRLADISDIRDESDRDGLRVVIEVKRDGDARKVLNNLYKHTALQSAFNVNMLALVETQPRTLSLKDVLEHYTEHRKVVTRRRTEFDLTRAKERAHILEGLKIALENLDAVVKTIRSSKTPETAHANLKEKFGLSDAQAKAILEMQLRRLTSLERQKIEDEYTETIKLIAELESILASPRKILHLVTSELDALVDKYADERRTKIVDDVIREFSEEELVADEDAVVTISSRNYIKRVPLSTFRAQHRGGRGVTGMAVREEDDVDYLLVARTHDRIYFFTDRGRVFATKVYELPDASRTGKGTPLQNILEAMAAGERVAAIVALRDTSHADFLVMATRQGFVKKTPIREYATVRRAGLIAIALRKGDELAWAQEAGKGDLVVLATRKGKSICFKESDARPMGRDTQGVTGIRLGRGDQVVGMGIARKGTQVLSVSQNGFGKRTAIGEFPVQGRGGSGVILMSLSQKTGAVASIQVVDAATAEVIVITRNGIVIRVPLEQVKALGRATMGVKIMATGEAKIASVETFAPTMPQQAAIALR